MSLRLFARLALASVWLVGCNGVLGVSNDYHLVSVEAGTKECTLNTNCAANQVCIFRTCSPPCLGDRDCDADFRCLKTDAGQACVSSNGLSCSDRECPAGTSCVAGACRNPCGKSGTEGCLTGQACSIDGVCVGTDTAHDPAALGDAGSPGGRGSGGAGIGAGGASSGGKPAGSGGRDGADGGSVPATGVGTIGERCSSIGAQACAGHGVPGKVTCSGGTWQTNGTCPTDAYCDTSPLALGQCKAAVPECSDRHAGDVVCRGLHRLTCGTDLITTTPVDTCTGGCVNGACTTCAPGATDCAAKIPRLCDAKGEWGESSPCDYLCASGKCAGECTPAATECNASGVRTCTETATWGGAVSCVGQTCVAAGGKASCQGICVAGTKQCKGATTTPQTCDATGAWHDEMPCTNVCSGGDCGGSCVPTSKRCNGLKPQTCDGTGSWIDGTACKYLCSATTSACAGVCSPGAKQCSGNGAQTCDGAGQWGTAVACVNQACAPATGTCVGLCTPGTKRCLGNGVQTCDAAGQWGTAAACAAATPTCANGACGSPPSCNGLAATCGVGKSTNCCSSSVVPGGSFYRSYDGATFTDSSYGATVSDFRLDNYEITVGRFRKFIASPSPTVIAAGAGKNPNDASDAGWDPAWNAYLLPDAAAVADQAAGCSSVFSTWATTGQMDNRPMNCINWYQAAAFCIWDGGRLPTEAEWNYAAAGGSEQRIYPWGSAAPDCSHVNFNVGGGNSFCTGAGPIDVGSLAALGNGKFGQSDLAGNVMEWTFDWLIDPYPTPCTNCGVFAKPTFGFINRTRRGGSFWDGVSILRSSTRSSDDPAPNIMDSGYGARCARTP